MRQPTKIRALIATLALAACAPGEMPEEAPKSEAARDAPGAPLPPVSVLIAHRVADYDAWKRVFDEHVPARKEASCLGHYLKRGVDDPNRVYVYCLATDVDRLRSFLEGTDLAETMSDAGVEGAPEITVMKPISRDLVARRKLYGIVIMHRVEDYESWRTVYDGFDEFRRQSGVVGHAVGRALGDPDRVIVYHQAESVADLRAFVESQELRETMQRAGVVGDPDIRFIRVVDFVEY